MQLQGIVNQVSDAIFTAYENGQYVHCNSIFAKWLGKAGPEEVLGFRFNTHSNPIIMEFNGILTVF